MQFKGLMKKPVPSPSHKKYTTFTLSTRHLCAKPVVYFLCHGQVSNIPLIPSVWILGCSLSPLLVAKAHGLRSWRLQSMRPIRLSSTCIKQNSPGRIVESSTGGLGQLPWTCTKESKKKTRAFASRQTTVHLRLVNEINLPCEQIV